MTDPNLGIPPEHPPLTPFYEAKIGAVRDLITAVQVPGAAPERAAVANVVAINRNLRTLTERPGHPTNQAVKEYLGGAPTDPFDMYGQGERIVATVNRGVNLPDVVDVMIAGHACMRVVNEARTSMPARESEPVIERARALVHPMYLALTRQHILREGDFDILSSAETFRGVYTEALAEYALPDWQGLDVLREMILDRLTLAGAIDSAGWTQKAYERGERNAYNRPLNEAARHEINVHAAEVIERLHLLKAYPVLSFEVKGHQLGLPWDVVVVPPIATAEGDYAEGAVADFMIMPRDSELQSTNFEYRQGEARDGQYLVTVGGASPLLRIRLHDNGQLTFGSQFHNVPNNDMEYYFYEEGAGDAFIKLRALLIALAADAVMPDDAALEKQLRGSVGRALVRPGESEPPQHRFAQLLLRRRQVLERAGVGPSQRRPQHWPPPPRTQGVRGYFLPLRQGYRPRPGAEQDAIDWYRAHNLPYPGWREGHTWTRPYSRSGTAEVTYRRAAFRDNSETARHIGSVLGIDQRRGRRRP